MRHECVNIYYPGYPTKEKTLSNPMLLKKTPERWKGLAVCCSAMSLLTLSACANVENVIRSILPSTTPTQQLGGVIIVTSQYILPEDDAVSIIADELALNGLDVDIDSDYKVDTTMPVNVRFKKDNSGYEYSELKTKLVVDGRVKDKNLCFEYISQNDFHSITTNDAFSYVSSRIDFMMSYLETKDNETLVSDKGELVKVFYENIAVDKDEAEQKLRQQVKEYIDQLKVSGVI